MGRATQLLLGSLDQGLELTAGSSSYVFLGSRFLPGWALELVLIAMLVPFLTAVVDLFAYCRRRRIRLIGSVRSYVRRLGFWAWVGLAFLFLSLLGAWPRGIALPPNLSTTAAGRWPTLGLVGLLVLACIGWLVARERLLPRRPVQPEERLAGYCGALLALAILALLTAASNPYALIFILPSVHTWLWLPQVRDRPPWVRLLLLAAGFVGPFLLIGSMAWRFGLGMDAPWYLAELTADRLRNAPGDCDLPGVARGRGAADRAGVVPLRAVSDRRRAQGPRAVSHRNAASGRQPAPPVSAGRARRTARRPRRALRRQLKTRYRTSEPAESSPSPRGTCTRTSAEAARAIMCDSCPLSGAIRGSASPSRRFPRRSSSRSAFRRTAAASVPVSNRGRGSDAPCSASTAGRTKSSNPTSDDTGFPGSPKTSEPSRTPNASGFPGLTATPQKISAPRAPPRCGGRGRAARRRRHRR